MFTEENIVEHFSAENKRQVLLKISELAFALEIVTSKSELLNALFEREAQTCTGMVNGIAIPHACTNIVSKPSLIYIKLSEPILWESLDGQPVDLVFALLAPKEAKEMTHLQMLSNVATGLMEIETVNRIRKAKSKKEIFSEISKFTI